MDANTWLQTLRRWDDQRPPVPAEHWLKLSLGLGLLLAGGKGSALARTLSVAAGGALIYRAFKGKNGLSEMLSRPGTTAGEYASESRMVRASTLVDGKVAAAATSPARQDVDIDMMEPQTRLAESPEVAAQAQDKTTTPFPKSETMP